MTLFQTLDVRVSWFIKNKKERRGGGGNLFLSLWLSWQPTLHSKQYSKAEREFSHLTPSLLSRSALFSIRASTPTAEEELRYYRLKNVQNVSRAKKIKGLSEKPSTALARG